MYQTDSVSMINWKIIHWLTLELELTYDYLVTLDGAAYPLVSAQELTERVGAADVWLGALWCAGEPVVDKPADHLLRHK